MVPRQGLIGGTALAVLTLAAPAGAVSRKVSVGDFRWGPSHVTVDRGDSVTWFWVGPDTQHSISGLSANAKGLDSDPKGVRTHAPGDRFKLTFSEPGVYEFHCKLHALVRGDVTVTDTPGTGAASPDPDPRVTQDFDAPELTDARWSRSRMPAGGGAELRYTLDEPARVTFDVMEVRRGRDRLRGTKRFRGHIGWNTWEFGGALRHRRLEPGRYRALLVGADAGNNHTGDVTVPFRVTRSRGPGG